MKNRGKFLTLSLLILLVPLIIGVTYPFTESEPQLSEEDRAVAETTQTQTDSMTSISFLPSVHIQTIGDELPFQERTLRIESTFIFENMGEFSTLNPLTGQIRGRGNSTWVQLPDKRPLRLHFDEAQQLFTNGTIATDWILLADHGDRSLLRNYSALHLARQLDGLNWTPDARSIHLYVNDEYQGVYLLTDERTFVPTLRLTADEDPTISEYFFEMEWRAHLDGEEGIDFVRVNSHPDGIVGDSTAEAGFNRDYLYEIIYPATPVLTDAHMIYLQNFLTEIGELIRFGDFEAISERVDLTSLIDFYLVQELYKNMDVGFASVFLQIRGQGDERRLYHGPVWDFDISAGNAYWMGIENQTPLGGLYVAQRHYWYWYLLQHPEFVELVNTRWHEIIRPAAVATIQHIEIISDIYEGEFERNFVRHAILGIDRWPSPTHIDEIQTFRGQVTYLTDFLQMRVTHLDEIWGIYRPMW
ncbi:MAG: CotH kinase family protein [Turicibacter sp.]|nr:CotH kinase family protein [Turicibacter sp.]